MERWRTGRRGVAGTGAPSVTVGARPRANTCPFPESFVFVLLVYNGNRNESGVCVIYGNKASSRASR